MIQMRILSGGNVKEFESKESII